MRASQQLENYLEKSQTPYLIRHHPRSITALQLAEMENIPAHEVAKVVILTDHKQNYMMVLPANHQLDLEAAREFIKNSHVTLATEDELSKLFPDCEVGAMPPFGVLYRIPVYADTSLSDDLEIEFHAGSHEDAVRMSYHDWKNIVNPRMGRFSYRIN